MPGGELVQVGRALARMAEAVAEADRGLGAAPAAPLVSSAWVEEFARACEGRAAAMDARDVAAYVKSLKPIENQVPLRKYDPIWKRLWTRMRQLVGLEHGRLEYPSFNVGSRQSQAEMLDARRRREGEVGS